MSAASSPLASLQETSWTDGLAVSWDQLLVPSAGQVADSLGQEPTLDPLSCDHWWHCFLGMGFFFAVTVSINDVERRAEI